MKSAIIRVAAVAGLLAMSAQAHAMPNIWFMFLGR
jgi:hypothetical protein